MALSRSTNARAEISQVANASMDVEPGKGGSEEPHLGVSRTGSAARGPVRGGQPSVPSRGRGGHANLHQGHRPHPSPSLSSLPLQGGLQAGRGHHPPHPLQGPSPTRLSHLLPTSPHLTSPHLLGTSRHPTPPHPHPPNCTPPHPTSPASPCPTPHPHLTPPHPPTSGTSPILVLPSLGPHFLPMSCPPSPPLSSTTYCPHVPRLGQPLPSLQAKHS